MPRRRRKYRPKAVEDAVTERQTGEEGVIFCGCGCEEPVIGNLTHFDHEPPLHLRDYNEEIRDYIPAENDPKFIFLLIDGHHVKKSSREARARTKVRHIRDKRLGIVDKGIERPPSGLQSRGFDKTHTRGFDGKVREKKRKDTGCDDDALPGSADDWRKSIPQGATDE
jgi:hypothetical protein